MARLGGKAIIPVLSPTLVFILEKSKNRFGGGMKIYNEENAKQRKETGLRVPRLSLNSNFSSELRSRW